MRSGFKEISGRASQPSTVWKAWSLVAAAAGAVALLAATAAPAAAEIRIGIAGPLTGAVALNGEQQELGAQVAVRDINEAGGVLGQELVAISADDACDADQAVAVAGQLVAEEVAVVIGHFCSRTTIAASAKYGEAGIVNISPASTNPLVTDRGLPGVFRVIGRDDDQAAVAVDFIRTRFPDASVALVHDGNPYGQGLVEGVRDRLVEAGVEPVYFGAFPPGQDSYAEVIGTVAEYAPDVVYAVGNGVSDVAILTSQLKAALPDAVMVSADSIAGDNFLLVARDAAPGTFFTFGPDARALPSAAGIVERFREEEAFEPAGYTLYAYAAVQAWAQAVEMAGTTDAAPVAEALRTGSFETALGTIGFDEKGDVTGTDNFVVYEWGPTDYSLAE